MLISKRGFIPALFAAGLFASACHAQSAATLHDQIDKTVRAEIASKKFSGVVFVTRRGETLYRQASGLADRAANTSLTPERRFHVASLSKPFTAVLIMQLVEEGRLKVTDRLDAIFPNLVGKPAGAVTLDQLLAHTSGMEEIVSRHLDAPLTPAMLEDAKINSPGKYSYASSTYVVLKLVIEKVSGQDYAARLKEKILVPAGMADTGLARQGDAVPGLAIGYKGAAPAATSYPIERVEGAGSLYTTVDDLARFDRALTNNVLLTAATQKTMYAPHSPGGSMRGYGWALGEQGGRLFPWHKGDIAGYTAILVRQVQRGELIVVLSNTEGVDLTPLRQKVLRLLKDDAKD
jgi:CubicO group peptidase (beta-lactamase class C family)